MVKEDCIVGVAFLPKLLVLKARPSPLSTISNTTPMHILFVKLGLVTFIRATLVNADCDNMAVFVGTYGSQCSKLLVGPLQGKFLHQRSTFYKEDSCVMQIAEKLTPGCPSFLSMFLDQSCP